MKTTDERKRKILEGFRNGLIVSCQVQKDDPIYTDDIVVKMAQAAKWAGAAGIRANSPEQIRAIKAAVDLPLIGLYKIWHDDTDVFITPTLEAARQVWEAGAEIIVLAGFMSILSERFTSRYAGRILNVHPSLIPKFCGEGFYGLKVHEAVLAAGEKVTGATVHYVNEIPDGGDIIFQKEVEVKEGDTPEILQRRVMEEAEWKLLPLAVEKVAEKLLAARGAALSEER